MSKEDDLDVDARLNDGFQYQVTLDTGLVRHYRDHDAFAAVFARLLAASAAEGGEQKFLSFSGARAIEGEGPDGADVLGPVRGRGAVNASRVVDIVYSASDGTEIPNQAFEAAVAFLDVQRAALDQLGQKLGQGAAAGGQEGSEDANDGLLS